ALAVRRNSAPNLRKSEAAGASSRCFLPRRALARRLLSLAPMTLELGIAIGITAAAGSVLRYLWRPPTRCRRDAVHKWTSAGGVVINDRGEIAIVLQRDRHDRLRWTLPKGRVDRGETAERAALREVHEESGLRARIVRPL